MYIFKEITKDDSEIFSSWLNHDSIKNEIAVDDWHEYFEYVSSEPDYYKNCLPL